jgi:hypothetical protein
MVEMNFAKIKKYHVSIFTTNLLALVLSEMFIKSYKVQGTPVLPIFLIVLAALAVFILISIFLLKPTGRIKTIFPSRNFIILNMAIAVILGLIFIKQTGFLGFCFVLLFAFFLFEVEHLIYGGMKP